MGLKREGIVALCPGRELLGYWCQGCDCIHVVNTAGEERPRWAWNGDVDKPTLSPSIRTFWPANQDRGELTRCHHFLRDGVIEFLPDSGAHQLRGLHPLQPIPADYGGVD
jgi:hypothetical protein